MTDLKELLRSAAAEAENVSVDGSALLPAIRRRRRIRSAAVGVGSVTAVTTLAVGAYAVLPGAGDAPVSGGAPSAKPSLQHQDCNQAYNGQLQRERLKVALTQKTMKRTGNYAWSGTARITLTNSSDVTVYSTTSTSTLFFVVPKHGDPKIVGSALAKVAKGDFVFRPGGSAIIYAQLSVAGCPGWKHPAGTYLVYESINGAMGKKPVGTLQLP
ncbi:hypothetical protein ABZS29_10595 [Kribbella sp. NPDC005582]|uniref:hypothetical protein n=1 Tax=Kribbella sp. NPDC005582 TaxID=3156893 RepID=UPI0033B50ED3